MQIPDSFIKNVVLELHPEYELDNTPYPKNKQEAKAFKNTILKSLKNFFLRLAGRGNSSTENTDDEAPAFIGRKQLVAKFLRFLQQNAGKGIFLVTGYRGMGKTSFVNHVLGKYRKNKSVQIHLTISQSQPKEIDILRLITIVVYDKYSGYLNKIGKNIERNLRSGKRIILSLIFIDAFISLFFFPLIWRPDLIKKFLDNGHFIFGIFTQKRLDYMMLSAYRIFAVGIILLFILCILFINQKRKENKESEKRDRAINRIKNLAERCYASVTEESGDDNDLTVGGFSARLFAGSEKRSKHYPIVETKELEYELQQFLDQAYAENQLEFIFIFDELDKVDPAISTSYLYDDIDNFENKKSEDAYQRELRDRKQAIINIIAGLKNFFTTAQARFIFIAGREMFDASLADVADRQSSISSIFTYIFNVESFLKEKDLKKQDNNGSLSNAIEEYLMTLILSKIALETNTSSFFELINEKSNGLSYEKRAKIYFTLQNFITYLTYRSNGSAKKLIKIIHEFIVVKSRKELSSEKSIMFFADGKTHDTGDNTDDEQTRLYLYFNYYNQYRIGFISYLYRPFLIQHGRSLKLYSDNIILSTPYLFDHLIKFHPFAFSLTNMELIPEVLSTNKTPYLREHIKQIISYLSNNHIRDTDVELFDYKFYSRTINEIKFISKVFEQESAAFNFTLDESYLIKLHIRSKIKELRSIYSRFLGEHDSIQQQIFSIAHLNGVLGDLHFFDQEYDDAIVAYSDAIRPINHLKVHKMNMRDFITLIRNKLKLGLCFEKISSYEEALAFYSDSCLDAKRFMIFRLDNAVMLAGDLDDYPEKGETSETNIEDDHSGLSGTTDVKNSIDLLYQSSSMNDVLQTIIQCFLAKIIVQEKMGVEGFTFPKLSLALGSFIAIAEKSARYIGRSNLIISNAYLQVAKLLYFKNTQASTKFLNEFIPDSPNEMERLIKPISKKYGEQLDKINKPVSENYSTRKPILALYLNIIGICEVLESRKVATDLRSRITADNKDYNIVYELLTFLTQYHKDKDERFIGFHYRYIGTFLSDIGDCLLSMCIMEEEKRAPDPEVKVLKKYNEIAISDLFNLNNENICDTKDVIFNPDSNLDVHFDTYLRDVKNDRFTLVDVLKCYFLSGTYYKKHGRTVSCSFQYRKILHLLRLTIKTEVNQTLRANFLSLIKQTIVEPILSIISQNAAHSDRHMIKKARKSFKMDYSTALNNVSNHPETREIILLYHYIRIKLGDRVTAADKSRIISPDFSLATQHSRLLELDFHAKYLYQDQATLTQITTGGKEDIKPAVSYLFNMLSILRILSIYGTDYLLGYSYSAYTHYRIAKFLGDITSNKQWPEEDIETNLEALLGRGSYAYMDKLYHFQKASDYYEKAIQLHTAGTAYKKSIGSMNYLEDDFNDNAHHFGAALDRYMMINNVFSEKIEECKTEIRKLSKQENGALLNSSII